MNKLIMALILGLGVLYGNVQASMQRPTWSGLPDSQKKQPWYTPPQAPQSTSMVRVCPQPAEQTWKQKFNSFFWGDQTVTVDPTIERLRVRSCPMPTPTAYQSLVGQISDLASQLKNKYIDSSFIHSCPNPDPTVSQAAVKKVLASVPEEYQQAVAVQTLATLMVLLKVIDVSCKKPPYMGFKEGAQYFGRVCKRKIEDITRK